MEDFKINVNEIENATIAKLNRKEIGRLGLSANCGVYTFKGTPKKRKAGMKTTLFTDTEIHYESDYARFELIKIPTTICRANEDGMDEWAARYYDKEKDTYLDFWQVVHGCGYFK